VGCAKTAKARAINTGHGKQTMASLRAMILCTCTMILAVWTLHSIDRRAISMGRGEIPMRVCRYPSGHRLFILHLGAPR